MKDILYFSVQLTPHQYYDINTGNLTTIEAPIYRPGEVIAGHVLLQVVEPIKARAVRLQFYGLEYVHIQRTTRTNNNTRTNHYYSRIFYANSRPTLIGRPKKQGNSSDNIVLQPNIRYSFPFVFVVPPQCPPSHYHSHNVNITYGLSANIDLPWKVDAYAEQMLTILPAPVTVANYPIMSQVEHRLTSFFFFDRGVLPCKIEVPKHPLSSIHEELRIGVTIDTARSKLQVKNIGADLKCKGTFHASNYTDRWQCKLASTSLHFEKNIDGVSNIQHLLILKNNNQPLNVPAVTINGQAIQFNFILTIYIQFYGFASQKAMQVFDILVQPGLVHQFLAPQTNSPVNMIPNYPMDGENREAPAVNYNYWPPVDPPKYQQVAPKNDYNLD